ncbi:hypothetical protein ACFQZT_10465 [Paenibacillus sp. GCM10027628]
MGRYGQESARACARKCRKGRYRGEIRSSGGFRSVAPFWGATGKNRHEPAPESAKKAVTGEKSTLKWGISICSALLGRYGQESARAGARKCRKGRYRLGIHAQAGDFDP